MNILITGDFYISDSFLNKNLIDQSVIDLFADADYRIVNLEAPITANHAKNKIVKTGPHLRMSEETAIPYLKKLNVDALTLANNHILDYGVNGLDDTFTVLNKNKIAYVGSGNNLKEATQTLRVEKNGLRIAILNFCENEWSIAEEDKAGANPMDIINNVIQIKAAKVKYDKVICIIHGGHEHYNLPSPRMVKQYRFYVDSGADAIVGHHAHCISGFEEYNNSPILYNLGNFIFTKKSKYPDWYTGLVTNLEIKKDAPIKINLVPVRQSREFKIQFLNENEKKITTELIDKLNSQIKDQELLKIKWDAFLNSNRHMFLNTISTSNIFKSRIIRALLNRTGITRSLITKHFIKTLLNNIRCEAHQEAIKDILKKELSPQNTPE